MRLFFFSCEICLALYLPRPQSVDCWIEESLSTHIDLVEFCVVVFVHMSSYCTDLLYFCRIPRHGCFQFLVCLVKVVDRGEIRPGRGLIAGRGVVCHRHAVCVAIAAIRKTSSFEARLNDPVVPDTQLDDVVCASQATRRD